MADGFTERHGVVQVLEQPRGARLDGHRLASDAAAGPLEANHKRLGASLVILTTFSARASQHLCCSSLIAVRADSRAQSASEVWRLVFEGEGRVRPPPDGRGSDPRA